MSITESSVIQPGSRVRVRRGQYPADPALVGREGLVVVNSPYQPHRVEVALDGDAGIRIFSPAELELLSEPEMLPVDRQAARKRLSRP
jgi:hypothetical protein